MKYAIIADIHSNLEALQAVLQDMKTQGCTHTACLGDIVGYNANPKECLDIIRVNDMDGALIELHRVDYDVSGAQGKVDAAGLPRRPR